MQVPHSGQAGTCTAVPAAAATALQGVLRGRFVIPATEVQQLQQKHGLSEAELLQALIPAAAELARPPISDFRVGAVGLAGSGAVYIGVNLEFPGAPLNNSVHAEQFLLSSVAWHGESELKRLAVSAAPCGHCRQFYSELACADTLRISFGSPPAEYGIADLLPQRFGPADLLSDPTTPLLLQPQNNQLQVPGAQQSAACKNSTSCHQHHQQQHQLQQNGCQQPDRGSDSSTEADEGAHGSLSSQKGAQLQSPLIQRALSAAVTAANQAYAPYTHCPSGAAVITAQGDVFEGVYIESAAFNPSLSPLQAALATAVRAGLSAYGQVQHVVLVEVAGTKVQHADNIRLLLARIAPNAQLTVVLGHIAAT